MPTPLASLYRHALDAQGFVSDPAQWRAVELLDDCLRALHAGDAVDGVYLWGPVGRGKTWLMDRFHQALGLPSRRQHFHHFMRWVHRRLFQLTGTADPLQALADELAAEVRVLCFDELFVSDIGDAILIGGLFQKLFGNGLILIATSNQPPSQLYADGFNRERFLPAIAAIERHMQVLSLDGGQDHRLHPGAPRQRYWVRAPQQPSALRELFGSLSADGAVEHTPLELNGRELAVVARSDTSLWATFAALCEAPWAAQDYIALCDRYRAILLGEVPELGGEQREGRIARGTEDAAERVVAGDRQLPALARNDNAVRRFIALVDECYDRGVPLYIEADVPLERLYERGYLAFPFRRTASRLREMQLERFGR